MSLSVSYLPVLGRPIVLLKQSVIKMNPVREYSALADLLDRALQKGLYVSADVIITVADVPLIGLNLRLALANIETMFDYGLPQASFPLSGEVFDLESAGASRR